MYGDEDRCRAGTGTGVEASKRAQDGNDQGGDGNINGYEDGDGAGTRMGLEASERTQDNNGDVSGTGTRTESGKKEERRRSARTPLL